MLSLRSRRAADIAQIWKGGSVHRMLMDAECDPGSLRELAVCGNPG
jgi:hypothetical protein